jgi:DNA-binding NarL/FixJ family response regulator
MQGLKGIPRFAQCALVVDCMRRSRNTEVRAALQDDKRMSVAIAGGTTNHGLKILIEARAGSTGPAATEVRATSHFASLAQCDRWPKEQKRPAHLTAREVQVLRLITKGLHNRQIAEKIHRSIKTVEKHRQNLHVKLSTHEVTGLIRHALAMGLTDKSRLPLRRLEKGARQLTPRELEILKLVAQGSGNKWIASELHRSIKTVDHHRENIMKKLGIHEVAGLTRYAFSLGLL